MSPESPEPPAPAGRWQQLERIFVWLVALHSLAVGAMLLFAPVWSVAFGGWPGATPLFFPRQAGVFHFVAVLGYLLEYHRSRTVTLMVGTKTIAFVFLLTMWAMGEPAWSVPFSGLADGAMGVVAVYLHRAAERERGSAA